MDNEKIMELMANIYSELKELKKDRLQDRASIELIASELKELKEGRLQDRASIELIAAQTELLTVNFEHLETEFNALKTEVNALKAEVNSLKEIVVRIENEQGKKINILFNGHLQNKEKIVELGKILEKM